MLMFNACVEQLRKVAATYFTILAVLLTVFFYENSVVGRSRIPRTLARIRWIEREVELMSLAMQSTRGRRRARSCLVLSRKGRKRNLRGRRREELFYLGGVALCSLKHGPASSGAGCKLSH